MLKDVTYALELARDAGLELQSASTVKRLLEEAASLGFADAYHTAGLKQSVSTAVRTFTYISSLSTQ